MNILCQNTTSTNEEDNRSESDDITLVSIPSNPTSSQLSSVGVVFNDLPDNNETENVNVDDEEGEPNCPVCREEVEHGQIRISCDMCKVWYHRPCLDMTEEIFRELETSSEPWYCMRCLSIKANKIKWGEMEGEETIQACISKTYKEVTSWRKNLFMLPRGKAGTDFIRELTRLIYLFVNDTKWSRIGLPLVHIFLPLMLRKPSSRS